MEITQDIIRAQGTPNSAWRVRLPGEATPGRRKGPGFPGERTRHTLAALFHVEFSTVHEPGSTTDGQGHRRVYLGLQAPAAWSGAPSPWLCSLFVAIFWVIVEFEGVNMCKRLRTEPGSLSLLNKYQPLLIENLRHLSLFLGNSLFPTSNTSSFCDFPECS